MKFCRKCKVEKELSEFRISKKGYVSSYCTECHNLMGREWRKANPEKAKTPKEVALKHYLRKFYGLTVDQYEAKLKEQNGCCAVCKKHSSEFKRRLAVDHNHQTGQIRGLLCVNCNNGLGCLKEDVKIIKDMIVYIEAYRE